MSPTLLEPFEQLSIRYTNDILAVIDQTKLPKEEIWVNVESVKIMWDLIKKLSVRGAPLIGVAAVMSLAVEALKGSSREELISSAEYLITSRPTAVNLMYCCERVIAALKGSKDEDHKVTTCRIAQQLLQKEIQMNENLAKFGGSLVADGEGILTHCNTGTLATPGLGTALGAIRGAWREGKKIHVWVDETRPLLQGGRLTSWELGRSGIPYTLITDSMAASLMAQGKIQRVFVGADRIALNGDFANKIGTYSVAVCAKFHGIPFHVVAPLSTVDFDCSSGADIPIELRNPSEVMGAFGTTWAPQDAQVYNPAFDVTPVTLVTSLILDSGVYSKEELESGCLKALKDKQ